MVTIAAYSDLLAMLPRQWLDFIANTELLHNFTIREELVAPPICVVRRARLPLTAAAEHLCGLSRRAADRHIRASQDWA